MENQNSNSTENDYALKGPRKSRLAAGLFAIFLGTFGIHNFYQK